MASVSPDGISLLNRGLLNDAFMYFSRAVPSLAICPVFFCSSDDLSASELDVDRVTFAITLCSFLDCLQ